MSPTMATATQVLVVLSRPMPGTIHSAAATAIAVAIQRPMKPMVLLLQRVSESSALDVRFRDYRTRTEAWGCFGPSVARP